MVKRIGKYGLIFFALVLLLRVSLGMVATSQIKKDMGSNLEVNPRIVVSYSVIIADKVKTYTYGQETTGVFEKVPSVYYYDGKVVIQNDHALRQFLLKDINGVSKMTAVWPEEVTFIVYETIPRFYDDVDQPEMSVMDEVEAPLVIYELNALNMVVAKYTVDKDIEYLRMPVYERK